MGYAKLLLITFGAKPGYGRVREAIRSKTVLAILIVLTIAISIALYTDFYRLLVEAAGSLIDYRSYIDTFNSFVNTYLSMFR
jgi:hypothetical protein